MCTPVNCLYTTCPLSKLLCIPGISKVREDEMSEMDELLTSCRVPVQGGVENTYGKVNVLLQTYISCNPVESFSLTSDLSYVAQVREREREREREGGERRMEEERGGGRGTAGTQKLFLYSHRMLEEFFVACLRLLFVKGSRLSPPSC